MYIGRVYRGMFPHSSIARSADLVRSSVSVHIYRPSDVKINNGPHFGPTDNRVFWEQLYIDRMIERCEQTRTDRNRR
jgi:hypothetical protein